MRGWKLPALWVFRFKESNGAVSFPTESMVAKLGNGDFSHMIKNYLKERSPKCVKKNCRKRGGIAYFVGFQGQGIQWFNLFLNPRYAYEVMGCCTRLMAITIMEDFKVLSQKLTFKRL